MDDFLRLNEEVYQLFPQTPQERQQKFEMLQAMPEFVL